MEIYKLVCKACGSDSFTTGEVGGTTSQGNVKPIGTVFVQDPPLFLLFVSLAEK